MEKLFQLITLVISVVAALCVFTFQIALFTLPIWGGAWILIKIFG